MMFEEVHLKDLHWSKTCPGAKKRSPRSAKATPEKLYQESKRHCPKTVEYNYSRRQGKSVNQQSASSVGEDIHTAASKSNTAFDGISVVTHFIHFLKPTWLMDFPGSISKVKTRFQRLREEIASRKSKATRESEIDSSKLRMIGKAQPHTI